MPVSIVHNEKLWKVRTEKSVYEYTGVWKKNLRFSDYIDIDSRYRIGYISRQEREKLALQNLPLEESYLILLDRKNARTTILTKGKDIQ
jgi:hypothetical protein